MSAKLTALLKQGKPCTFTISEGGDLASMRAVFKYGQEITISPVTDFREVRAGDVVYVHWRGGGYILHPVKEIRGDQFLIINSLGEVNGWVHGSEILGKMTQCIDPPARPKVPEMLALLLAAYQRLAARCSATPEDSLRLESIVQDLRWYMERIPPERWSKLPRQNRWSFESNLWYLTKQACEAAEAENTRPITEMIDQGKWIIGLAAEIVALFEEYAWETLK
jgi:hypothetical protein